MAVTKFVAYAKKCYTEHFPCDDVESYAMAPFIWQDQYTICFIILEYEGIIS